MAALVYCEPFAIRRNSQVVHGVVVVLQLQAAQFLSRFHVQETQDSKPFHENQGLAGGQKSAHLGIGVVALQLAQELARGRVKET